MDNSKRTSWMKNGIVVASSRKYAPNIITNNPSAAAVNPCFLLKSIMTQPTATGKVKHNINFEYTSGFLLNKDITNDAPLNKARMHKIITEKMFMTYLNDLNDFC